MSDEVKPVRAWAEYDEWAVFFIEIAHEYEDAPGWEPWEIPKAGNGRPYTCSVYTTIVDAIDGTNHGPLRSIRVLLSNGAEVRLETQGRLGYRQVKLRRSDGTAPSWGVDFDTRRGFVCIDDAEAVERAIAEATVWFAAQEEAK